MPELRFRQPQAGPEPSAGQQRTRYGDHSDKRTARVQAVWDRQRPETPERFGSGRRQVVGSRTSRDYHHRVTIPLEHERT